MHALNYPCASLINFRYTLISNHNSMSIISLSLTNSQSLSLSLSLSISSVCHFLIFYEHPFRDGRLPIALYEFVIIFSFSFIRPCIDIAIFREK